MGVIITAFYILRNYLVNQINFLLSTVGAGDGGATVSNLTYLDADFGRGGGSLDD